jgi:hypothetical protein
MVAHENCGAAVGETILVAFAQRSCDPDHVAQCVATNILRVCLNLHTRKFLDASAYKADYLYSGDEANGVS